MTSWFDFLRANAQFAHEEAQRRDGTVQTLRRQMNADERLAYILAKWDGLLKRLAE